jgi:hypothetical protein
MESDVAAYPAQEHTQNPEGETCRDEIPPGRHVKRGKHEEDKSKHQQYNPDHFIFLSV